MTKIDTLIIGAGPAGLAVAGRLRHQKLPFEIVEQTDKVGWAWHNHYDRLHLHTVKQLSALPHLPFPESYPLYVPREKVVQYLETYTTFFNIEPHFNTSITKLENKDSHWIAHTDTDKVFHAENVVIATGVNRVPNIPTWSGQEDFKGNIIHSRAYKNPQPFKGKKVLIIGMGNTGAELAFDLSEHNIATTIAVRNPISVVPRDLNGQPVQLTAKKLAKLPFGLGDWLGSKIRRVYMGDLSKYGIPLSTMSPTVQLRETGKTPVIDIGTVKAIKEGKIKVIRNVDHFFENGIVSSGEKLAFDSVILATGYRAKIEDFVENIGAFLDKYGCPKGCIGTDNLQNLYFVGFDNYKTGGILGTIAADSETVVNAIAQST